MAQKLVAVRTDSGAFSTERAVSLTLANGEEVSLFADDWLVDRRDGNEYLKVVLVKSDAANKTATVLLPSEANETSSRWATVAQHMVISA